MKNQLLESRVRRCRKRGENGRDVERTGKEIEKGGEKKRGKERKDKAWIGGKKLNSNSPDEVPLDRGTKWNRQQAEGKRKVVEGQDRSPGVLC